MLRVEYPDHHLRERENARDGQVVVARGQWNQQATRKYNENRLRAEDRLEVRRGEEQVRLEQAEDDDLDRPSADERESLDELADRHLPAEPARERRSPSSAHPASPPASRWLPATVSPARKHCSAIRSFAISPPTSSRATRPRPNTTTRSQTAASCS